MSIARRYRPELRVAEPEEERPPLRVAGGARLYPEGPPRQAEFPFLDCISPTREPTAMKPPGPWRRLASQIRRGAFRTTIYHGEGPDAADATELLLTSAGAWIALPESSDSEWSPWIVGPIVVAVHRTGRTSHGEPLS